MVLESYRGKALSILSRIGAEIGDQLEVKKGNLNLKGVLMPSYSSDDSIVVLKLDNGYNVGLDITAAETRLVRKREERVLNRPTTLSPSLKGGVKIISTGGTIASRVEYETGAVRPALTTEEIVEFVPELKEIAEVSAEVLFSILSENMTPELWVSIAKTVKRAADEGSVGVVVAHGTDTMSYTAAALAFSLRPLSVPVVLVGSQRSSDRPSSDASINLLSSVILAKDAPFGEVSVLMHKETSDTYGLAHRGVKVRKMHTSRRDAFQSINDRPLAKVDWRNRRVIMLREDFLKKGDETGVDASFDKDVFLLKIYPGLDPSILSFLVEKRVKGMIVEGTGLGHTPSIFVEEFKKLTRDGIFVGMTSQCIFGRVNMNVYTTGRELLKAGVVPLEDMLPEVALVKLMWTLAHTNDPEQVKSVMRTNLVGEINYRHMVNNYPRWDHE